MGVELDILLIYAMVGVIAGLLAGLFGVGGGLIIVPALSFVLPMYGVHADIVMKVSIATSLAIIVFTSMSSIIAHHRKGAVLWAIVFMISPGILLGGYVGAYFATSIDEDLLKWIFVCYAFLVALQMLAGFKPAAARQVPGLGGLSVAGGIIGSASAVLGIGGGSLSVPYLVWCGTLIQRAVATSAAIGFPISVSAVLAYIVMGFYDSRLPDHSLGYVYIPALIGIGLVSVLFAPLGARLAHRLPKQSLSRGFAILLIVLGLLMLFK